MCRGDKVGASAEAGKTTIVMPDSNSALLGSIGLGVYSASTVFEIRIDGGDVKWFADGELKATYTPPAGVPYPLRVLATSYNTQDNFVNEVEWVSGLPPAQGTLVVFNGPSSPGYTATPGAVDKTAYDASWDSGAWTNTAIFSAMSKRRGITFRCAIEGAGSRDGGYKTIGLSSATDLITGGGDEYTDVYQESDFGVMCRGDEVGASAEAGKATIVMLGSNSALLGSSGLGVYSASTVFEIRIDGGDVKWFADGEIKATYTPPAGVPYPLRVLATSYNTQVGFVNSVGWLYS